MRIRYCTVAPTGEIFVARFQDEGIYDDTLIDCCGPIPVNTCTEGMLSTEWDFSDEDNEFLLDNMSGILERPFPGDLDD